MTSDELKEIAKRELLVVWQEGHADAVYKFYAADFVNHNQDPSLPPGREGFYQAVIDLHRAYKGIQFAVDVLVAEGDLVTRRWTFTASEPKTQLTGIDIMRVAGGQVVDAWTNTNPVP